MPQTIPQTLAQKILQMHSDQEITAAGQIVNCRVSLVLANDITAPLSIKSFREMGVKKVFDKDKIALVMDHFTPQKDIASANQVKGCREFAREQNITHYFEGGDCGVEHALLPELGLVGPGDIVVGADSHTCTYGGLGAFATGLGSTDIAAAMALGETWFKVPSSIKVTYCGTMPKWLRAKDLILLLIKEIGVDGALYKALEFDGSIIDNLDMESRMTMANMAIEAGAKVGIFPIDDITREYCKAHNYKGEIPNIRADADAIYERHISFDVTKLTPVVACPHLPENVKTISEIGILPVEQVVIGSCTNGRISDLRDAAKILKGKKVNKTTRCIILPATPAIWKQALREGLIEIFMDSGCIVGPATCGPCLGGHMGILADGERAIATTNRNFRGRMGSLESEVYLSSPVVAAASAITGIITDPALL